MDSRQKTKGEQNEYRVLIAQDVEYLRCKQMLTVGVACVGGALWGLRPLSYVVSSLPNLQSGWNGFIFYCLQIHLEEV